MRPRFRGALAGMVVLALAFTGCASEGGDVETPTGDELFRQAEQHYRAASAL